MRQWLLAVMANGHWGAEGRTGHPTDERIRMKRWKGGGGRGDCSVMSRDKSKGRVQVFRHHCEPFVPCCCVCMSRGLWMKVDRLPRMNCDRPDQAVDEEAGEGEEEERDS